MPKDILESICKVCEVLPFMCLSTEGRPELNTARLAETLIIAFITGSICIYGTVKALEVQLQSNEKALIIQLENMNTNINKIDKKVNSIYRDFYKPRVSK